MVYLSGQKDYLLKQTSTMRTIKYSKVKIKSNFIAPFSPQFPNYDKLNKAETYFKRKAKIDNILSELLIGIDANGKFLTNDNYLMMLPCPPFCDPDEGTFHGKIIKFKVDSKVKFFPEYFLESPFTRNDINLLTNNGAEGFLNIKITIPTGGEKQAIIGLDKDGNIMNNDDDLVVYVP